jgi:hypothetical protein
MAFPFCVSIQQDGLKKNVIHMPFYPDHSSQENAIFTVFCWEAVAVDKLVIQFTIKDFWRLP